MIRTLDATAFNRIANTPTVRPWLGGTDRLDLTAAISNPENFAFLTDDGLGGYIYHRIDAGLFMVHTLSDPAGRGRAMLEARSESLREVFTKSDAVEVVTIVPAGNKGADLWANHAGFREVFGRQRSFDLMGEMVDASYRSLSYGDWVKRDRGNLHDGRAFHSMIHAVTTEDHHPDDPVHDAWVGATMECCAQGAAEKGIALYNRYAVHAGYRPIRVLTAKPLVVDIGTAVLQSDQDGLRVLYVPPSRAKPSLVQDESGASAECLLPPSVPLPA